MLPGQSPSGLCQGSPANFATTISDSHPLEGTVHGGNIKWNFGKFLIDRDGKVIDRFGPRTKPMDKDLVASLEKQLAKEVPADSPLAKKQKEEKDKDKDKDKDGDKEQPEKKDA